MAACPRGFNRLPSGGGWRVLFAVLLVGGPTGTLEARAAIQVTPGGHTPFGGVSGWAAHGFVLDQDGTRVDEWDHAELTPAFQLPLTIQNGNATVDLFNNVGTQTAGTATLSAAARISAQNLQSGKIYARGFSLALINDRIQVVPADSLMTHGIVELEWTVHGHHDVGMVSSQLPLNARNGLKWAHYATAETFVTWRNPSSSVDSTDRMQHGEEAINRIGSSFTDYQKGGLHFLETDGQPNPQTLNAQHYFLDGVTEYAPTTLEINQARSFVRAIHVPTVASVEVMLGLVVTYNAVWDLEDFGGLDVNLEAMFDQTAELTGVRLFNSDGTPHLGQWSLVSQNGVNYPLAPVPEPSALALAAAGGLLWLGCGRRRASGT